MEVINPTPFEAAPAAVADLDGADLLVVVAKATYALDGDGGMAPADEQRPVEFADRYHGDPEVTSIAYASDLAIGKTSTDVVLAGGAYPGRSGAAEAEVGVQVGPVRASFRVFGDREWQSALGVTRVSRPQPFDRIPLMYERAAGGTDRSPSAERDHGFDDRNPVGVGFRAPRTRHVVDASPLPNFELAEALIRTPDDRPPPAPVGFVAPGWQPRRSFAGTYDERWSEMRSPWVPEDFDVRFFDVAGPGLTAPGRLDGTEHGAALGLSPHGLMRFTLPGVTLSATVQGRKTGDQRKTLGLDRIVIDGEAGSHGELILVWSAGVRLNHGFHDLRAITLST